MVQARPQQREPVGEALRWPTLREALCLQCPVCWSAPMFKSPWAMQPRCPHCGHEFDRGNGYFLGAMFFSYALVVLLEAPLLAVTYWLSRSWITCLVVGVIAVLPLGPLLALPVSRWLWVTIERRFLHDGSERDDALRAELERRRAQRSDS